MLADRKKKMTGNDRLDSKFYRVVYMGSGRNTDDCHGWLCWSQRSLPIYKVYGDNTAAIF